MLKLEPEHLHAIKSHAEADYPHECGGLLLGHLDNGNGKFVVETLPMENTAEVATRHDRVLIEPRDLMLADRKARECGLDVIGYYHSHPETRPCRRNTTSTTLCRFGHTSSCPFGDRKRSTGIMGNGERPVEI